MHARMYVCIWVCMYFIWFTDGYPLLRMLMLTLLGTMRAGRLCVSAMYLSMYSDQGWVIYWCLSEYIYLYVCTCTCTCICIYGYIHTYILLYVYAYLNVYVSIYMHTHTHTHTNTQTSPSHRDQGLRRHQRAIGTLLMCNSPSYVWRNMHPCAHPMFVKSTPKPLREPTHVCIFHTCAFVSCSSSSFSVAFLLCQGALL
jgi:hypothetical protein